MARATSPSGVFEGRGGMGIGKGASAEDGEEDREGIHGLYLSME